MQCFVQVDQVRISYLEFNPKGAQTIFFVHGNSASAHIWLSQLNSPLLAKYRLIAFDLPAHGQSDALPAEKNDYSMKSLGFIMASAVDQLQQDKPYILAGVSVGSNVITEMVMHGAKPQGMVIIGSCIIGGEVAIPHILYKEANLEAGFSDNPTDEALINYLKGGIYFQEQEVLQELVADFRQVKDQFRTKLGQTVAEGLYSNEVKALEQYAIPLLVIFGDNEKVIDIHYMDALPLPLWKNTIYKLPQAGHFTNIDQPVQVNTLIAELAAAVFK